MRRSFSLARLISRLMWSWKRLISNMLGSNNLLAELLQISGPLAIGCGLLLLMCLIFTLRYKSRKKSSAATLSVLTGIGSGLLALLWAHYWCSYNDLEIIPVALVFIVLLILLIVFIRTAAACRAEKRKAREAQLAAMAGEPVTGAIEFADIYVVNQGRDPHAVQKIRGLYALLQENVITKEEYTVKVAQLMERL